MARKKNRHIGIITAKYVETLQGLCRSKCLTTGNITDIFNELRCSLSRGGSTACSLSPLPSRRSRGHHGDTALQRGSADSESFDRPCISQPGKKRCWLVSELQPWNRVLSCNFHELREHSWGELTLLVFKSTDKNTPDTQDVLRTSLLMHLLLQAHRCITRLVMDQTIACVDMAMFFHALQNGGAGVRQLEFTGSLSGQYPAEWFSLPMWSHSVISLPALHTLRVSCVAFDEDVAHTLGSYMERTTTLRCIAIKDVQVKGEECRVFLDYLALNKTVTRVKLEQPFVMARQGKALAHVLENHVSLEHLELEGDDYYAPSAALRAVLQSSSLKSLTVRSFTILAKDIEPMAAALTRHQTSYSTTVGTTSKPLPTPTSRLENLTFINCAMWEPRLQCALAALIGGALVKLKISMCSLDEVFAMNAASKLRFDSRLRVLDIKNNGMPSTSITALIRALEVNSTLERMTFNLYGTQPETELFPIFNTIRDIGASSRIHVDWFLPRPAQVAEGGGLCTISHYSINLDNCSGKDVTSLLKPLTTAATLPSACIRCSTYLEQVVVQQLVDTLGQTKSVRKLWLLLDCTDNTIVSVLRSLQPNRSVSVIVIGRTIFKKRSAKALAELVEKNRMLNAIVVDLGDEDSEAALQVRAILRELKEAMPRNRFLTNVVVNLQDGNHASDFDIKDVLRRNRGLVNQAVHFVTGSNDKKDALSFEVLQYSRTVLRELCNGDEERDEARAKAQITAARWRLALNFFIFAGVVKAKIVCRPHPKGKPTLDMLGKSVQACICSYLNLGDILDI